MKSLEERKAARAKARAEQTQDQSVKTDYTKLKKAQLQQLLRDREFEVDDKDTVADLIAALEADDAEKANQAQE